jgi:hypothetical protein
MFNPLCGSADRFKASINWSGTIGNSSPKRTSQTTPLEERMGEKLSWVKSNRIKKVAWKHRLNDPFPLPSLPPRLKDPGQIGFE